MHLTNIAIEIIHNTWFLLCVVGKNGFELCMIQAYDVCAVMRTSNTLQRNINCSLIENNLGKAGPDS